MIEIHSRLPAGPAKQSPAVKQQLVLTISLTRCRAPKGELSAKVTIATAKLIAYDQLATSTRLRLAGGETLEVHEKTCEIDRMIRSAASGNVHI